MTDWTPAVYHIDGSFRDPSGFMFVENGVLYRQINRKYQADYDLLTGSGLCDELIQQGKLVPHEEADLRLARTDAAYKIIRPQPLPFVSYPYEWCFGQLRDAALLTLEVQAQALRHGLTLKDASAYNVQFIDDRPVLIDTLSFAAYEAGSPWVAYRQFCQHFLAPLALVRHRDASLSQLLRLHIDGIPLQLASKLLPARTKWDFSLQVHIHTHARMQTKSLGRPEALSRSGRKMSLGALRNFIEGMRQYVAGMKWTIPHTTWSDYYQGDSYEEQGLEHKKALVQSFLE